MTKQPLRSIVNAFQSDATEIIGRDDPVLARITVHLLTAMVVVFVVWACVGKLDKVVTARAAVETVGPKIVVQSMQTAIIKELLAQPGDLVKAGQTLAVLDNTFAKADNDQSENRARALDAQTARLEAERDGKPFNPVISGPAAPYLRLQKSQFDDRTREYASRLHSYDEKLSETKSSLDKRRREIELLTSRLAVGEQVVDMRKALLENQTGSRLNYLQARNDSLELEHELELARSTVAELGHQLEGVQAERQTFIQGWQSAISEELSKVRNDRDSQSEQVSKAQRMTQLVLLQSPVDAVVLDLAERSVGSVVREAEPLYRLIPVDAALEFVAYVPAGDIGAVNVGDAVQVKLDAFPYTEHGVVKAWVRSISADSFTAREAPPPGVDVASLPLGANFYKARLTITAMELTKIPANFRLIPGMTGSAEVKVGKRTIMAYLLSPVLKSFDEGMRDP